MTSIRSAWRSVLPGCPRRALRYGHIPPVVRTAVVADSRQRRKLLVRGIDHAIVHR